MSDTSNTDFAALIERELNEFREALLVLLTDIPMLECIHLHHPKEDRHESHEDCPVLRRYRKNLEKLRKMAK